MLFKLMYHIIFKYRTAIPAVPRKCTDLVFLLLHLVRHSLSELCLGGEGGLLGRAVHVLEPLVEGFVGLLER